MGKKPLEILAKKKQLMSFKHKNFWHPMDTQRDKNFLEKIWIQKKAHWKNWK